MMTVAEFAKVFDMAVLKQDTQEAAIREGAKTARKYNLAAYYTNPCWTKVVAEELAGSDVLPGTGIGFPYGTSTTAVKLAEMDDCLANGAKTIDMMINIGALKDKKYDVLRTEAKALVDKCKGKALAKVILEVGLLAEDEIAAATKICCECGVDYIKTSTGTDVLPDYRDLEVIRANLSGNTKMKLSGVPRQFTLAACLFMIDMGVELIGTRSAGSLVDQYAKYLETRK